MVRTFFNPIRMHIISFKFKEKCISIVADISILTLSSALTDAKANGGFDLFLDYFFFNGVKLKTSIVMFNVEGALKPIANGLRRD